MMVTTVTFDSFVATGNAFEALELSRALACAESAAPNLLLLHGPPGSGKTHLLHAVRDAARSIHPSLVIVRTNARELVDEMMAEASHDQPASAGPLWPPGALVTIDDLHTLSGKVVTQREIGRLLETALARGCRLVCAVGGLAEIPVLAEVIPALPRARVVELRRPNQVEVRMILGALAKAQSLTLTAKMLDSIAAACHGDVRLAAGALARQRLRMSAAS